MNRKEIKIDLSLSCFEGFKKKGIIRKLDDVIIYSVFGFTIQGLVQSISTFLSTTAFLGLTWGQVIWYAISIGFSIYSVLANRGGKDSLRDPNAMDANGQLVNTRQSSDPLRIIYGIVKTGGVWVFNRSTRNNNTRLNTVITWSEGEIEGIDVAVDSSPIFNGGAAFTTLNDMETGGTFAPVCTCYLSAHGYVGCTTCDVACHVYTP